MLYFFEKMCPNQSLSQITVRAIMQNVLHVHHFHPLAIFFVPVLLRIVCICMATALIAKCSYLFILTSHQIISLLYSRTTALCRVCAEYVVILMADDG
jgi:hypothetical protein